jgi:hypothetical protein
MVSPFQPITTIYPTASIPPVLPWTTVTSIVSSMVTVGCPSASNTCQKTDMTSQTYTFTTVVATQVQVVTASCASCIGGSTVTLVPITSTSFGPYSSVFVSVPAPSKTSVVQVSSPAGPVSASSNAMPPSSILSVQNSVPSAQLSTSNSVFITTVEVSKGHHTSTLTVTSTAEVIVESSLVVTMSQATDVASVISAGTPSVNINVPSVSTADAVSPSSPMNTQATVTVPVFETQTVCPTCDMTAVQPPTSAASSPAAPPMSNDMSSAAPPNVPSSPATEGASMPMSSPVAANSMGASSPPAEMLSSPLASSGPPSSATDVPSQNTVPPQNSSPPEHTMPPQNTMPSENTMPSQPSAPAQPSSPSNNEMPPQQSAPAGPIAPPASNMPPQGSAPPQSGPAVQPSSPAQSNSPPQASSPQASSPPQRTGTGSSGGSTSKSMLFVIKNTLLTSFTEPSMAPPTNTNMASGSTQNAKTSMLTVAAPMIMAVVMMLF